ncbi:MAG TPA: CotH kinase family protein [Bacteroidia bacterium]|nr:CotH kinase family protein [Bacteroidia bacterium]
MDTIQKIEISFTQPNWDYMLDTAKAGADGYLVAEWVKINNIQFDSAGVKYKGNISYDSTYAKNPVHIAMDEFKQHSYQGFTDIKLGNGYADPSLIREVLSYDILKNYMDCPRSNFAQLYINGVYTGLYSNTESINKEFCSDHFYSSQGTFIKCNPLINPGPATKSNLKYILPDSSSYFNFYEIKSDYGWNDLVSLCDTVTNFSSGFSSVMDLDRVIWMLAFNNVLINLDSYSGVFCQNYYLYKDNTNHFNPVVWDLNMSFGGFPYLGSSNNSMASLTIANMQQLPLTAHSTDPYWPLINAVMNNPQYKRMFIAHARTITNEMFAGNSYQATASQLQTVIDTAVQSDVNNFFTYSQFQTGMTTDNTFGSYVIPGISNLMSARNTYLQSTAEFTYVAPVITSVTPSNSSPGLNSPVTVTAQVTNTSSNAVYLGYRFDNEEKFQRILMYDDGAHNDGAAGDNVYGESFNMISMQCQYYIYAENNDAGMFSPERAEHEFHILNASIVLPLPGEIVINEFLASNQAGQTNETGQFADWIEIYNNTSITKNLYGLYLTDNFSNPAKFSLPQNADVPPNGYLMIWADEKASTPSYIHCNFKLSASGEELMLSNGAGYILDSLSFGTQFDDISTGRCPNGNGGFTSLSTPSFNAINCPTGISEQVFDPGDFTIFPNPANSDAIFITNKKSGADIIISNAFGQQVLKAAFSEKLIMDVSAWSDGVYFVKCETSAKKFVVKH